MAVTVLLFRDTPFDNEDILERLSEWLANVAFFDDKAIKGELNHCTFQIEDQPRGVYGYMLNLNDEQLHTPDLWTVYLGATHPENILFGRMGNLLAASTKCPIHQSYMSGVHGVVQYKGGANSIRNAHAENNRKGFGVVE